MKSIRASATMLLAAVTVLSAGVARGVEDRTITKVVKLLEGMLEKSHADGDVERELFAKHKCYCDQNEEEKNARVEELTTSIGMLESKVEELKGSNGVLSSQCAQLEADMAANEAARDEAATLRKKEKEDFDAEELDLTAAIGQLKDAIHILAEVGADQTLGNAAADHTKFMASYPSPAGAQLLKVRSSMKQALLAAGSFLAPAQRTKLQAFLQEPFTGTYTTQSAEIIGILKQMRDTFTSNLESARSVEAAALAAHEKFMNTKVAEHGIMRAAFGSKQGKLGSNDDALATKKQELTEANAGRDGAEGFLRDLADMCAAKTKDYEVRKMLRANEEVAISKAIAILNSDQAFQSFGAVAATSTGTTGFLQLRSIQRHEAPELLAQELLSHCAERSGRVRHVLALLRVGNPFDSVLMEIKKMVKLIDDEAALDKQHLDWCKSERAEKNSYVEAKASEILNTNGRIGTLVHSIENPEDGLKKLIADTEKAIEENTKHQTDITAMRKADNDAYNKNVVDIAEATNLLTQAVTVLKAYYSTMKAREAESLGSALLQAHKQTPPVTWSEGYTGQSSTGNDVIAMVEFILQETKKEESAAHKTEADSQAAFELTMKDLTAEMAGLQKTLVDLEKDLSEKELSLGQEREALSAAESEKTMTEKYLVSIKPGCDFITFHYEMREKSRAEEKTALNKATELLKETPVYKTAVAEADLASLGTCQQRCLDREHVECKACLAGVTVPGYCAGHPTTVGC